MRRKAVGYVRVSSKEQREEGYSKAAGASENAIEKELAPRVGLEPTTLRLRGFLLLPEGSDYLITRTV